MLLACYVCAAYFQEFLQSKTLNLPAVEVEKYMKSKL